MSRRFAPVSLTFALLWAAGCGAQRSPVAPSEAPASEPAAPPAADQGAQAAAGELDEAEQELAAAEQRLLAELDADQEHAVQELEQPSPTDATKPKPKSALRARQQEPCDVACRALSSMQQAAERICTLTSEADARCTDARQRVARAERRVSESGCGCG